MAFQKRFQPLVCRPPPPSPPPAPPPPSLAERAAVLIGVIDRLSALLGRECDAVTRGALSELEGLQGDKRDLAGRFDEIGRLVRLDKAGLAALPADLLAQLKESSRRLREITQVNVGMLDIEAAARKSVIAVAVRTVNHERQAAAAYAGLRQGYLSKTTRAPPGRSTTLNATL
ncbi:MAG: hypothetical protein WCO00_14460 [Rhodospirillaceae bacterium]